MPKDLDRDGLKNLLKKALCSKKSQRSTIFLEIENYYINKFNDPYHNYDDMGLTLLHWAILCKQYEKVIELVDQKDVDINATTKPYDRYCASNFTPIYLATIHCDENIIKFLMSKPVDLNIRPINTYYYDGLMNGEYTDELSPIDKIALSRNNPNISKLFEVPLLNGYIHNRTNDQREYKHSFSLFCHQFNFGHSRTQKLRAANQLKTLLENENTDLNQLLRLNETDPGVKAGKLGEIYKSVLNTRGHK